MTSHRLQQRSMPSQATTFCSVLLHWEGRYMRFIQLYVWEKYDNSPTWQPECIKPFHNLTQCERFPQIHELWMATGHGTDSCGSCASSVSDRYLHERCAHQSQTGWWCQSCRNVCHAKAETSAASCHISAWRAVSTTNINGTQIIIK